MLHPGRAEVLFAQSLGYVIFISYQEWRRFQPSDNRARKNATVPTPEMADTALNGAKTHR